MFKLEPTDKGLYKVYTSHGTYYEIDLDKMEARRVPAADRNELRADGDWFQILGMDNVEVGRPIYFACRGIARGDWYTWRKTTEVVSIEKISEVE